MTRNTFQQSILHSVKIALGLMLLVSCNNDTESTLPNIIYILADDLGYGDVSAFNQNAAWETVHIDRIAAEGMIFTDAHTGSAKM